MEFSTFENRASDSQSKRQQKYIHLSAASIKNFSVGLWLS